MATKHQCLAAITILAATAYLIQICIVSAPSATVRTNAHITSTGDRPTIYRYNATVNLDLDAPAKRTYFGLEKGLMEGLQLRGRFVDDPSKAQFFWVPNALVSHWITHYDFCVNETKCLAEYYLNNFRPFLKHIRDDLPYFNASGGRNHIFVYSMDLGPFCEMGHSSNIFTEDPLWKSMVHPMISVGYWGQMDLEMPEKLKSNTRSECWESQRDIAVPQWHDWDMSNAAEEDIVDKCRRHGKCKPWLDYLQNRGNRVRSPFFFKGQNVSGHACSAGIRPWIFQYCQKHTEHCLLAETASMTDGIYALCPAGFACWSSRMYDALHKGVIPVKMADNMVLPFSRWLNFSIFMENIETGKPASLALDGGPQIGKLIASATSWLEACGDFLEHTSACLQHGISQKMGTIITTRKWFGWSNPLSESNAFTMFEKELLFQAKQMNKIQ